MAKLLADRLTEAFAEAVHTFVRRADVGLRDGRAAHAEADRPRRIPGPPHGLRLPGDVPTTRSNARLFDLLAAEVTTGMRLTENWMIDAGGGARAA